MASVEPIKFRRVTSTSASGARTAKRVPLAQRDWRWRARYRDPNGRSRERIFDRKIDAQRWLETNGADMTRGEWVDPRLRRVRFDDWAAEWWATTVKLRPLTRRGYRIMLDGHVLPWFGGRPQASIDFLDVERFIAAKLKEGLGPKKVRDLVSIVSLVMRVTVRAGARKDNPALGHEIPVRRKKMRPGDMLDMAEIQRLVDHVRDPYKPAVWLLALLGLRPAELCGLRVSSVDFVRRLVAITATLTPVHAFDDEPYRLVEGPPKTEAGDRSLPIPTWLAEDLAGMLAKRQVRDERRAQSDDWLFESIQGGRPLNLDAFRKRVMRPALQAAGLPETFRTYDLRHAHASMLIDAGASALDVAHRMGHADPAVTLRNYGHLFEGRQEELTEQLDARRRASGSADRSVVGLGARPTRAPHRPTKSGSLAGNGGARRIVRKPGATRVNRV
ncbi:MAG: tyrosine-type recombinase/integrase [Acidimicrobiales bacterium]